MVEAGAPAQVDRRRERGERTRHAILGRAARLASAEGLEAVSLQRLADELQISKSGLFAHFGSKEELQLATIEEAARIFTAEVLKPGLGPPRGLRRVWSLCDAYLSYLERRVFPGGCFFQATIAEFDSKPGVIRDALVAKRRFFVGSIARVVRDAQRAGEIRKAVDADQLAWELDWILVGANLTYLREGDDLVFRRARRAVRDRLVAVATAKTAGPAKRLTK